MNTKSASANTHENAQFAQFLVHMWQEFLGIAEYEMGKRIVDTWLRTIKIIRWDKDQNTILVQPPNQFAKNWLEQHYKNQCEKLLARVFNVNSITMVFNLAPTMAAPQKPIKQPSETAKRKSDFQCATLSNETFLNPYHTFESFVVCDENNTAYSTITRMIHSEKTQCSPLVICGANGMGKTHLLHAVGNFLQKATPDLKYMYQTGNDFIKNYVQAVKNNTIEQLESLLSSYDLLLFDDLHILAKKNQTQQFFLKLFSIIEKNHTKLIITSSHHPRDIHGLSDCIVSRCEGGLMIDLQLPSRVALKNIILKKAKNHAIAITNDVAEKIAEMKLHSIRDIEGILLRLSTYNSLTNNAITIATIYELFKDRLPQSNTLSACPEKVITFVCKHFSVSSSQLKLSEKTQTITQARQCAMYLLRKLTKKTYIEIARTFNRSDHTTVIHACKKIDILSKKNESNAMLQVIEKGLSLFKK